MSLRLRGLLLFGLTCPLLLSASTDVPSLDFAAGVDPFVADNCVKCHGEKKQKGDFRIDTLSRDLSDPVTAIHWMDVLDMIESGEMPPEEVEDRPSPASMSTFTAVIREKLLQVAAENPPPAHPRIRRLSHSAMDHTVRDLTGVDLPLSTNLPPDPEVGGFYNIAETMTLSQEVMQQIQKNAHRIAEFAIHDGEDPKFTRTFSGKTLGAGRQVVELGGFKASFSNKHLGYCTYPADFRAPFPGRYRVEILAFAVDNRDAIYPDGVPDPLPLANDKRPLRNRVDPTLPRYVQLRALATEADGKLPAGSGAAPPPARFAGEFQVTSTATVHAVDIWLDAGESFFLHFGSGIRINGPPFVDYQGKKVPVGDALYVKDVGISGPTTDTWPLPLTALAAQIPAPRAFIETLLTRAFRRPVEPATLDLYESVYQLRLQDSQNRTAALRQVLEAALCSPRFLFNFDDAASNHSWAIACRLSYFLWNSMPDEELFNLAASGQLLDPAIIGAQARRLLADPRAERFVSDFTGQWLATRRVGRMIPDSKLFPAYDRNLEEAMKAEPTAFFREVLRQNLSVATFIEADFAMLNERLAQHYGIDGVTGATFRPVSLPSGSPRGGILGQAALMTATSDGTRTSPVIRGIWVLENILGGSVSPPPASVKPLEPDVRGALTIREMLEKHRTVETCNDCHRKIDPLGFALENFDPIGAWRDTYPVKKNNRASSAATVIDTRGRLPDGTEITDFSSLQHALLAKRDRFAATLVEKLFVHAMGRIPDLQEHHDIEAILARAAAEDYRLGDLVIALCQSPPFRAGATPPGGVTVARHP